MVQLADNNLPGGLRIGFSQLHHFSPEAITSMTDVTDEPRTESFDNLPLNSYCIFGS